MAMRSGKGVQVSDDQIEQLRSVLARTYEKHQPGYQFIRARLDLRYGSSARIHHGRVA